MQTENRYLDDFARVASGALGALGRVKDEIEALVRQQIERALGHIDLVTREEFEAVKDMAAVARAEQEKLAQRVAELEAALEHGAEHGPGGGKRQRRRTHEDDPS